MAYQSTRFPDELHFYTATLTDPSTFRPQMHVHNDKHLPWLDVTDTLPRHPGADSPAD